MARPPKLNADYFLHFVRNQQILRILAIMEQRWGKDGYYFFYRMLEILSDSDYHMYVCRDGDHWDYFLAHVKLDEVMAVHMINQLCRAGFLDPILWEKHGVLYCGYLVDNLSTLYERREQPLPTREVIVGRNPVYADINPVYADKNPFQRVIVDINYTNIIKANLIKDIKAPVDSPQPTPQHDDSAAPAGRASIAPQGGPGPSTPAKAPAVPDDQHDDQKDFWTVMLDDNGLLAERALLERMPRFKDYPQGESELIEMALTKIIALKKLWGDEITEKFVKIALAARAKDSSKPRYSVRTILAAVVAQIDLFHRIEKSKQQHKKIDVDPKAYFQHALADPNMTYDKWLKQIWPELKNRGKI